MSSQGVRAAASATRRLPKEDLAALLRVSSALTTSLDTSFVLQTAVESAVEVRDFVTAALGTG